MLYNSILEIKGFFPFTTKNYSGASKKNLTQWDMQERLAITIFTQSAQGNS
jgi:hypothetical protein